MNKVEKKEDIVIEDLIYEVRGQHVIMDVDLAKIYKCKNGLKEINQAVKNNIERFPEKFSWVLTDEEYLNLKCQFVTSSLDEYDNKGYNPRVFTEQGVTMLTTVFDSKDAIQTSIKIMDAFVNMRKYISNDLIEFNFMKRQILNNSNNIEKNTKDIKLLQKQFNELQNNFKNNLIFFEGKIHDAYSVILDILDKAEKEIIIIDNYVSEELLDILKDINIKIKIYSKNINETLIEKYQKEYDNVELIPNNEFNDTFIILDNSILYHCDSSFKDLGKKCFAIINRIYEEIILNGILERII